MFGESLNGFSLTYGPVVSRKRDLIAVALSGGGKQGAVEHGGPSDLIFAEIILSCVEEKSALQIELVRVSDSGKTGGSARAGRGKRNSGVHLVVVMRKVAFESASVVCVVGEIVVDGELP